MDGRKVAKSSVGIVASCGKNSNGFPLQSYANPIPWGSREEKERKKEGWEIAKERKRKRKKNRKKEIVTGRKKREFLLAMSQASVCPSVLLHSFSFAIFGSRVILRDWRRRRCSSPPSLLPISFFFWTLHHEMDLLIQAKILFFLWRKGVHRWKGLSLGVRGTTTTI